MAKKYYAVKLGKKVGVFDTWDECKKQVVGYSGAIYKSFTSYEEAYSFVNGQANDQNTNVQETKDRENIKEIVAYVDGSYSAKQKKYAYGCVILQEDETIKLNGSGDKIQYVSMRNVAGELLGTIKAIKWAHENKYDSITVHYDYEGIEKWANGYWKTNKQGTKEYLQFIKEYRKYIEINFVKVRAHSGDLYNEVADRLAKKALGIGTTANKVISEEVVDETQIFNKIMNKKDKSKNSIQFSYKNHLISESKLKKFVKEIWSLKGSDKKDIDTINLKFDTDNGKIEWAIVDKNSEKYNYKYEID